MHQVPTAPPLTQKTLAKQGCGYPFCGHDHTVLFMNSVCHGKAGAKVSLMETGELVLKCFVCMKFIATVAVTELPATVAPECHSRAAVEVSYSKATGELTIRCRRCEREVGRVGVV